MSMIKRVLLSSFTAMICMTSLYASEKEVLSPDGRLKVVVSDEGGIPSYQVFYDGVTFIEKLVILHLLYHSVVKSRRPLSGRTTVYRT